MAYFNSSVKPSIYIDVLLLIIRVFIGFAMLSHGFPKLQMLLEDGDSDFFKFLGLSSRVSLLLAVFAEFVCSMFLILGLFSRIALSFLIFTMLIAAFVVHGQHGFGKQELSLLYLCIYLLLIAFGSGKYSIDNMIQTRKKTSAW